MVDAGKRSHHAPDATADYEAGSNEEPATGDGDDADCVRLGEFGVCADASRPTPDAATEEDAGPFVPTPDASLPDPDGPCAIGRACKSGQAFHETQTSDATCEMWSTTLLRVKYTACESCGQSGEMVGGDVVIEDCGACLQVFRAGNSDSWKTSPNACRTVERWVDLAYSAAGMTCMDVYGSVQTAENGVTLNDGEHRGRLCRCDRSKKTCISCANGACGAD